MAQSDAFGRLATPVQRWVWRQGWPALREVQEQAILRFGESDADIVVSAATAGGKTEAAFLPIVSDLVANPGGTGFQVLAISPLKALINDQTRRLQSLGEEAGVAVHSWHGDVAEGEKRRALKDRSGILVITPESLEAMFVRHGLDLPARFAGLRAIVVDELHAFIAGERGIQLQSLMHRLERAIGRRVRRVGLSATLGDLDVAKRTIRPFDDAPIVTVVPTADNASEIQLQIRGYEVGADDEDSGGATEAEIAAHLFAHLRGTTNLVFAGSRASVETYADRLARLSDRERVPNEFLPHHGNLSREIRHDVEARLQDTSRPLTAVCTSTLELGIDVGDVASVAQIGPARSVAALRQRLGRSGRRPGQPARLRIYVTEDRLQAHTSLVDRLRLDTALAVAAVELFLEGWCEPPRPRALHLSTFLHQILSAIASGGGMKAAPLFDLLCATGPFRNIGRPEFVALLRHAASQGLVEQASDGTIMLGGGGEEIVDHHSFYAVFHAPEEYRVEAGGRPLGTLPMATPLLPGTTILFAGRRWSVLEVREAEKVILLTSGGSGTPVRFHGDAGVIHDRLAAKVRDVLAGDRTPAYLSKTALRHLQEGRSAFCRADLGDRAIVADGDETVLLPWCGSIGLHTLALACEEAGLTGFASTFTVHLRADAVAVRDAFTSNTASTSLGQSIGVDIEPPRGGKFDHLLPADLRHRDQFERWVRPSAVDDFRRILAGSARSTILRAAQP